jgi:hypothetical protein
MTSVQPHQVDVVGPRDRTGDKTRYSCVICKNAFDQAVYLEVVDSREMEGIITFLTISKVHGALSVTAADQAPAGSKALTEASTLVVHTGERW